MQVRATLTATDSGLRAVLGQATTGIEAKVLRVSDASWDVSVVGTYRRNSLSPQDRTNWAGETVTVPVANLLRVEQRTLDRKRTTRALVLGGVGAIVLVRLMVFAVEAVSGGDDGGTIITPP